jgi:hypothetical protein
VLGGGRIPGSKHTLEPQWPWWQSDPRQQSSSEAQDAPSAAQPHWPAVQRRRAQQSASPVQASRSVRQRAQVLFSQLPLQQSAFCMQELPWPAQGRHFPPVQVRPSQHWFSAVQCRPTPRQVVTQTPEQLVPEQQNGAFPLAPHASSTRAQPGWQIPRPSAPRAQPRSSQHSTLDWQAPPAAMQRGGPQIPPTQAPLQQLAPSLVHEAPSARQPNEQRPLGSQAHCSQHSESFPQRAAKSRQLQRPAAHEPEQQSAFARHARPVPPQ